MKKISLVLTTLALSTVLVACQAADNDRNEAQEKNVQVTLVVEFDGKTDTKEVTVEEGDNVMDVLEEVHEVEENQGMVTAIDGVSQDEGKKTYWMYDVNNEMAPKGVEEMTVSDGDEIKFYLQTFE